MNANLIVVGGPISVGKSTLVESLPYPQIPELDENDKLQMIILENTYTKNRVAPEVIELYFLEERKKRYAKYAKTLNMHVLDRSIFESLWFAKGNMTEKSFIHFKKLWKQEIFDLLNKVGKPITYILLTMNWETFKSRLFKRGREVEVMNFTENESFFKKHIAEYEEHMTEVFESFNVKYFKVQTDNLTTQEVHEKVMRYLEGATNA